MSDLQELRLNLIDDHPRNPRIVFRDDVIDGIAATLGDGEYLQKYAVHVRPVADRYELTSGHHRVRAARKVGLDTIWAWVSELSDELAYAELAMSNRQGELSPLEIGIHARHMGEFKGGRGKKGGKSAYARELDLTTQYLNLCEHAAEVYETVNPSSQLDRFNSLTMHLAAIHKAAKELWSMLVDFMLKKSWSAADTADKVKAVTEFDVSEDWSDWLPLDEIVEKYLATQEFSAQTVSKLIGRARAIVDMVSHYGKAAEAEHVPAFRAWLIEHKGKESWDWRKLIEYERTLAKILEEASETHAASWLKGDWREHIDGLADGVAALVVTDPPYGIDYQSDYRLDRKKPRKHEPLPGDKSGPEELQEALVAMQPKLREDAHVFCFCHWSNEPEIRTIVEACGLKIRGSLVWEKNNTGMGDPNTTFAPKHERIIHAVKGSPTLFEREADVLHYDRVATDRHPTEKPLDLIKRLIAITTTAAEIVLDPFGGVATVALAATELDRQFWACEIKDEYYQIGKERLNGTL